jgi:hypothetical protein
MSVVALKSYTAAEKSKDQLSRDFSSRSIFDFCNNIDPNETSASSIILALCRNFWNAPIDRVCVENPQMHRHGKERIPRR